MRRTIDRISVPPFAFHLMMGGQGAIMYMNFLKGAPSYGRD
jgi:hypothetical protein